MSLLFFEYTVNTDDPAHMHEHVSMVVAEHWEHMPPYIPVIEVCPTRAGIIRGYTKLEEFEKCRMLMAKPLVMEDAPVQEIEAELVHVWGILKLKGMV